MRERRKTCGDDVICVEKWGKGLIIWQSEQLKCSPSRWTLIRRRCSIFFQLEEFVSDNQRRLSMTATFNVRIKRREKNVFKQSPISLFNYLKIVYPINPKIILIFRHSMIIWFASQCEYKFRISQEHKLWVLIFRSVNKWLACQMINWIYILEGCRKKALINGQRPMKKKKK